MKYIKCFLLSTLLLGFIFIFLIKEEKSEKIVVQNLEKLTAAQDSGFNDENFYQCIIESAGLESNTILTTEVLATIKTPINCEEKNITDVTGIEKLTNVIEINLNKNNITNIDLSKNINLETIILSANNLKNLNIKNNNKLKKLYASDNKISSIDLSNNSEIENMDLSANQINNINLTNLSKLKSIALSDNKISTLNVKNNNLLESLYVSSNKLTNLDISNNKSLINLNVYQNQLKTINLTNNPSLEYLNLSDNKFTNLDISSNLLLKKLYVSSNKLINLDITKHNLITELDIAFNDFDIINLSSQKSLTKLTINHDSINKINISTFDKLDAITLAHYQVIPIYSKNITENSVKIKTIKDYFPKNITINNYNIYKSFNTDDDSAPITNSIINTNELYYRVRIMADNVKINNYSFKGNQNFRGYYEFRYITLQSNKYDINNDTNVIYVGKDNNEEIKNNLKTNWNDIMIEINENKLNLIYNEMIVKEFILERVSSPKTGSSSLYFIILLIIISVSGIILSGKKYFSNRTSL